MPTFDLKESQYEPIEIKGLNGKDYTIATISAIMLKKISDLDKNEVDEDGKKIERDIVESSNRLDEQLSIFLGEKPIDYTDLDIRVKQDVVRFIVHAMNEQMSGRGDEGKESDAEDESSAE